MTKPRARLVWFGDTGDPLAVWCAWVGAGWDYTLHWGDGSAAQRMLHWQPPVKHTYPAAGSYTITGISDLTEQVTMSDRVTVRPGPSPAARMEDLGGGRCRLHLRAWPEPVDYRVDWGDGTVHRYDAGRLTPDHTYPLGIDRPTIVVADLPARRVQRLPGPVVPPPMPDSARMRWVTLDAGNRVGELRLTGFPPTTAVTVWWLAQPTPVVTDGNGNALLPDLTWPKYPADRWWSPKAGWVQDGRERMLFMPVHPETMVDGTLVAAYTIDPDDPASITVLAYTGAEDRIYALYWGDDTSERVTPGPDGWIVAGHRYPRHGDWQVRLEGLGSGGRTSDRLVQPATPEVITDGPDYVDYDYRDVDPCGHAAVLRGVVDGPDGRDVVQTNRYDCLRAGVRWGMPDPGDYTITFFSAMQDPIVRRHTTKTRGNSRRGPVDKTTVDRPAAVRWRILSTWQGGYTGEFRITHPAGGGDATGWRVEFTLPEPAVIAEVITDGVRRYDLGASRYALAAAEPLAAGQVALAAIRVEPAGEPRVEPADITAVTVQGGQS